MLEGGVIRMGVPQVVSLATTSTLMKKMNGDGRLAGGHNAV